MPSDHAQVSAFLVVYLTIYALANLTITPSALKYIGIMCMWVCGAAVMYSRVYLTYHTERQVYVGMGVGAALGLAWWALYNATVGYFPVIASTVPFRQLHFKDTTHIPNVLAFEQAQVQKKKKK
eukprot:Clim_evm89s153 gene=Clim_evmTU89s153